MVGSARGAPTRDRWRDALGVVALAAGAGNLRCGAVWSGGSGSGEGTRVGAVADARALTVVVGPPLT
jgi:hypothetical protein